MCAAVKSKNEFNKLGELVNSNRGTGREVDARDRIAELGMPRNFFCGAGLLFLGKSVRHSIACECVVDLNKMFFSGELFAANDHPNSDTSA
jgi:hypothetical protein